MHNDLQDLEVIDDENPCPFCGEIINDAEFLDFHESGQCGFIQGLSD